MPASIAASLTRHEVGAHVRERGARTREALARGLAAADRVLDEHAVREAGRLAEAVERVVGLLEGRAVGVLARPHVLAALDPHAARAVEQDVAALVHVRVVGLDDAERPWTAREAPRPDGRHAVTLAVSRGPARRGEDLERRRRARDVSRVPVARRDLCAVYERRRPLGRARAEHHGHEATPELELTQIGHPVVLRGVDALGRAVAHLEQQLLRRLVDGLARQQASPRGRGARRDVRRPRRERREDLAHARVAGDAIPLLVLLDHAAREQEHEVLLELERVQRAALAVERHIASLGIDELTVGEAREQAELGEEREHVAHQPEVGRRRDRRREHDLPHHARRALGGRHGVDESRRRIEHAPAEAQEVGHTVAKELPSARPQIRKAGARLSRGQREHGRERARDHVVSSGALERSCDRGVVGGGRLRHVSSIHHGRASGNGRVCRAPLTRLRGAG